MRLAMIMIAVRLVGRRASSQSSHENCKSEELHGHRNTSQLVPGAWSAHQKIV